MDDLQTRIKVLLDGDEIEQLKLSWIKQLSAAGVDEGEARQWVA